ncbi:MAG: hypothetical protein COA53_01365 [Rhodobacteraceae bacterium]|nr:MAG: hypothetical protein COA53_01365 [Paracoccaceae bacterium]
MADYREISQQYAQGAIKAVILVNSGALIASLSQLDSVLKLVSSGTYATSATFWLLGTVLGITSWMLAFFSTRNVDRTERGENTSYLAANFWMHATELAWFLSLGAFCYGGYVLIGAI